MNFLTKEFFQDVTTALRARAYRFTNGPDNVDDVVQEAFLRLYERHGKRLSRIPVWPWLQGTLRNLLRDHWKNAQRHRCIILESPEELESKNHDSIQREISEVMEAAQTLPQKLRKVLRLRFRGMTNAEVARLLGLGPHMVRRRLQQAIAACKRKFEYNPVLA